MSGNGDDPKRGPDFGEEAMPDSPTLGNLRSGDGSVRVDREEGGGNGVSSGRGLMAARLDRERRRAVRAEGRLAEIEVSLRRVVEKSNGDGVSATALRNVLDSVQRRVASLEDEVEASERELLGLVEAQRARAGKMQVDDNDLAYGLEQSRRELDDSIRSKASGLPELTRQRVEFEVELDRLQSLLTYRDNVCDGLSNELEQGTRVAAEVTARLADLSRGRVAPARRPATQDARVATLRRNLETEQTQLRQARRGLEAARAEVKVAQRGVLDIEEKTTAELLQLRHRVSDLNAEMERREQELQGALARAEAEKSELAEALDRERAHHVRDNERLREMESHVSDLDQQLSLSGDAREEELREQLTLREDELRETESERIMLAERVSLLQAALSSKESELRRLTGGEVVRRGKGKVVSLMRDHIAESETPGPAVEPSEKTEDLLRQRESEIESLSERWRELQHAYRDAVAEFDDVREKRDRLLLKLGPDAANQEPTIAADDVRAPLEAPPDSAPPTVVTPADDEDSWVVQSPPARRVVLVHVDDNPSRLESVRDLAASIGVEISTSPSVDVPSGTEVCAAINLLAAHVDALDALVELTKDNSIVRALMYCAVDDRGSILGMVDVYPAPFDPRLCAPYMVATYPRIRRVMTVGDSLDSMSQLRELLGQSRCSTAVAFDGRQAMELIPLVKPEYVLVDISLPGASGVELLLELGRRAEPKIAFGVTWSKPIDVDAFRATFDALSAAAPLPGKVFSDAVNALLAAPAQKSGL